jgi:hypothetical protein
LAEGIPMPDIHRTYDYPSMPESVVTLIDALGAYIRNMEDPVESEIEELSPALTAHLAKCKELLGELKEWELDPSLFGIRQLKSP